MKVRTIASPRTKTRTSLANKIKIASASVSLVAMALTVTFFWNDIFTSQESVAGNGQLAYSGRMHIDISEMYLQPTTKDHMFVNIRLKDDVLKSVVSGGNLYGAKAEDIRFMSPDGELILNHEIEYYNDQTGEMTCWLKLPSLYPNNHTEVILQYGNPQLASLQDNGTGSDVFGQNNLLDADGNAPLNPMETDFMEDTFDPSSPHQENETNQVLNEEDVSVYPNPNDGNRIQVEVSKPLNDNLDIRIYNEAGSIVYTSNQPADGSLDIVPEKTLNNGLYVMQLACNGTVVSKKLLVKN